MESNNVYSQTITGEFTLKNNPLHTIITTKIVKEILLGIETKVHIVFIYVTFTVVT